MASLDRKCSLVHWTTSVCLVAAVVDRSVSGPTGYGILDGCVAAGMLGVVVVTGGRAGRSSGERNERCPTQAIHRQSCC